MAAAAASVFCSARHSRGENNKIDDKLCLLTSTESGRRGTGWVVGKRMDDCGRGGEAYST